MVIEGPRAPKATEYPNLLDFLNKELRPETTWSLASEYPTALGINNINNIRVITKENQFLSHAVIKPLILKTPAAIFKLAAIGSVVTNQGFRNQGLSTQIINSCLEEAQKQECDMAILWTNLHDFYRKMNFELGGFELSFTIDKELTEKNAGIEFKTTQQISPEALLRLYTNHTVGSVRTAEDIKKFLTIPKTILYTAWDKSGQLLAYAAEGKGADLTDYVHEWGGSVANLMQLFSFIYRQKQRPYTLIAPLHSQNLVQALHDQNLQAVDGFLGMIKILNHNQVFNKIKKHVRTLGIFDFVLEKKNDTFFIGIGKDVLSTPDEKDIVQILFGPVPQLGFASTATAEKIDRFLPMPLWVWGWDSV